MMQRIYTALIAFLFTSMAWAQLPSQRAYFEDEKEEKEKKEFERPAGFSAYVGLAGSGIAGPSVAGEASGNYGRFNKVGILGGLAYNAPVSRTLDFQAELMMIRKGAAEPSSNDPNAAAQSNRTRIGINFLEIPVGVRYHMYLGESATALSNHVSADFLLTGSFNVWEGFSDRQTDGYVTTNSYDTFVLGYILGVNYHLNKKIILTFRWNNSLTPLTAIPANPGTETTFNQIFGSGPRSQTLNIQMSYVF